MTEQLYITESFKKLQDWAEAHAPEISFRPPAADSAIDTLAQKIGLPIPDDLRLLLRLADGETKPSAGMIGNWRLMPIAEIQAAWGWISKIAEKGAFEDLSPQTPTYIRPVWWHPGWLLIVSIDAGQYFCLDMDPPDQQRTGQVILFQQDQPERPLVAGSLQAWFDRIARDLESGVYTYDEENGFNGEGLMWSALEEKHLFDDIPGKFVVKD